MQYIRDPFRLCRIDFDFVAHANALYLLLVNLLLVKGESVRALVVILSHLGFER